MFDPALLKDQMSFVEARLRARGLDPSAELAALASIEAERRRLIPIVENLKREQNEAADAVARAKKAGEDPSAIFAANKARGATIKQHEAELADVEQQRDRQLLTLPNLPHESVPEGKSADDNVEVRRWGTPKAFTFAPKPHWDLGAALGILDFERAARMSGARFSVLSGGGRAARAGAHQLHARSAHARARLSRGGAAVSRQQRGADGHRQPAEVRTGPVQDRAALGFVPDPDGRSAAHQPAPRGDPRRAAAAASSTRRTRHAFGAKPDLYGADVRGLIRQHQFDKVELVKFATPEQSHDELEKLTRDAETVLERLDLPYRRMLLCAGDMGFASAKTYDIEVWLPSSADVSRDLVVQQLRGVPGPSCADQVPRRRHREGAVRAHAERVGPGRRTHADCHPRELSAGGRHRRRPRRAARLRRYGHHQRLSPPRPESFFARRRNASAVRPPVAWTGRRVFEASAAALRFAFTQQSWQRNPAGE